MPRLAFPIWSLVVMLIWPIPSVGQTLDELTSGFTEEVAGEAERSIDDLESGFAMPDSPPPAEEQAEFINLPSWLSVDGSLGVLTSYSFAQDAPEAGMPDYRGYSIMRSSFELIAEAAWESWQARLGLKGFYDAAPELTDNRTFYTTRYLDEYEDELEVAEAYVLATISANVDLKVGRQIVVWGKSDTLRVTDILNPLDLRQLGLVDVRDLRLPVTMSKLDYYIGDWNINPIILHEPRFSKTPVFNGDFFSGSGLLPPTDEPAICLDNQQYALALNGIFRGWDLSFYGASVFVDKPYLAWHSSIGVRRYSRALMTGLATNVAVGNWLWKAEAAYWDGLRFSNVVDAEKSRLDMLFAFEYSGFSETLLSFEVVYRHLFSYDEVLAQAPDFQKEDLYQYAFRLTRDFLHDTLHLNLLVVSNGLMSEYGGFQRCQLEYDLTDALSAKTGIVFYQSGDFAGFGGIGDNDRVFLELKYRF